MTPAELSLRLKHWLLEASKDKEEDFDLFIDQDYFEFEALSSEKGLSSVLTCKCVHIPSC